MASQTLSKALDKLDQYLQSARGSIGSPKAVSILNDLIEIQRFIQENGHSLTNYPMIDKRVKQIRELLGMASNSSSL